MQNRFERAEKLNLAAKENDFFEFYNSIYISFHLCLHRRSFSSQPSRSRRPEIPIQPPSRSPPFASSTMRTNYNAQVCLENIFGKKVGVQKNFR